MSLFKFETNPDGIVLDACLVAEVLTSRLIKVLPARLFTTALFDENFSQLPLS